MVRIDVVAASHEHVGAVVVPGDFVIDATAGNGGDTLFLSRAVGAAGLVLAIDIQRSAIQITRELLIKNGLVDRCILVEGDHVRLAELAARHAEGRQPSAVMFNLGYLPGGDKNLATRPETTVAALTSSRDILRRGGIISVVVYRGHRGAIAEAEAVEEWLERLDPTRYSRSWLGRDDVPVHRPYVVFVRSLRDGSRRPV